ncbi:MAG: hypothetical protein ACK4YP_01365 [Myxococcota bacterium]
MVAYYDIFRHPLTEAELRRLCGFPVSADVDRLVVAGTLERFGGHVTLPGRAAHVPRRVERTAAAERRWPAAMRAGRVLAAFPWVRGVLVTGGLSKQSTEPDGDVDFLLLVEPGSVWAAKSALQGLRRVLPESGRDLFCTNYLLATDALALDDRNVFTAMELATAVPLHGADACVALLEANRAWAERHVPGYAWSLARARNAPTHALPLPTRLVEAATGPFAPRIERAALAAWDAYWNRKYAWLPEATRDHRFKRRPEVATNHLHDFQGYVLAEYARRCADVGITP